MKDTARTNPISLQQLIRRRPVSADRACCATQIIAIGCNEAKNLSIQCIQQNVQEETLGDSHLG